MPEPAVDVPVVDVDDYGREALLHPERVYDRIREVLRAPEDFTSRHGVAMNDTLYGFATRPLSLPARG